MLARQINHKSISDSPPDAVISPFRLNIPLLRSHPLCLVFLPHPDSFFSVKVHQRPAIAGCSTVLYGMAARSYAQQMWNLWVAPHAI